MRQVNLQHLHPSVADAYVIAEDYFNEVILDEEMQDLMGTGTACACVAG